MMKSKDDNREAWQSCYQVLKNQGYSHNEILAVLKGIPREAAHNDSKGEMTRNSGDFKANKPFIGHSWQL